jgi:hypothetical protein
MNLKNKFEEKFLRERETKKMFNSRSFSLARSRMFVF